MKKAELPSGINEAVKQAFEREFELKTQLKALMESKQEKIKQRKNLKEINDSKKAQEKKDKIEKLTSQIDALFEQKRDQNKERNDLFDELRALGGGRDAQEEASIIRLKKNPLEDEVNHLKRRTAELARDTIELKKQAKMMETKLDIVDEKKLEQEVKKWSVKAEKGDPKKKQDFMKEKSRAEKNLGVCQEYWAIITEATETAEELEEVTERRMKAEAELEKIKEKEKELKGKVDKVKVDEEKAARAEINAKLEEAKKREKSNKGEIDTQINKLKEQRTKARDISTVNEKAKKEREDIDKALDEFSAQMEALEEELKACRASVPSTSVDFPDELMRGLIGPGGARKKEMEEDYNVLLRIEGKENKVFIYGGEEDLEAASEAVKQALESAKEIEASRKRDTFTVNKKDLMPGLIGKEGANIRAIEQRSGVNRLSSERGSNVFTIVGTEEAIEACKALIKEQVETMTKKADAIQAEKDKPPEAKLTIGLTERVKNTLFGRNPALLRRITEATSTSIECNTSHSGKHSAFIAGPKDGVEAAKVMLQDLERGDRLEFTNEAFDVLMADRASPLRAIEKDHGAVVLVRRESGKVVVSVHGVKESTESATAALKELLAGKEIKVNPKKNVEFPPALFHTLNKGLRGSRSLEDGALAEIKKAEGVEIYVDRGGSITISHEDAEKVESVLGKVAEAIQEAEKENEKFLEERANRSPRGRGGYGGDREDRDGPREGGRGGRGGRGGGRGGGRSYEDAAPVEEEKKKPKAPRGEWDTKKGLVPGAPPMKAKLPKKKKVKEEDAI